MVGMAISVQWGGKAIPARQRNDHDAIVVLIHNEGAVGTGIDGHGKLLRNWQRDDGLDGFGQKIHDGKRLATGVGRHQRTAAVVVVNRSRIDSDAIECDGVSVRNGMSDRRAKLLARLEVTWKVSESGS
jgi:hypothetical protein